MKNLKKLSRSELRSLNGGIQTCYQDCPVGYHKCCIPRQAYYCAPAGSKCGATGGPGNPGEPMED
ncbi:MAG: hypothetical protein EOO44_19160 [Flavobacterium sp.]|nr:MAG: hypothetical protein EOO44_19160 [Flavobacterium sp.]